MHLDRASRVLATLILMLTSVGVARPESVKITVGDAAFDIPAPADFAPVTPEMGGLNQLLDTLTPPMNARFAAFISKDTLPLARDNKVPELARYFSVQTSRKLLSRTVTSAEFATVKEAIRKQNEHVISEAQKQVPGLIDKMNKDVTRAFGTDLGLKSINMVPFPPHEETERTFAFSMIMNYTTAGSSGAPEKHIGVVTGTLVHLRGKILYLYANGGEKDLAWTRQASKHWSAAVVAANPSDAATAAAEGRQSGRGFNWRRVLRGALIGAVAGAALSLIQYWRKKNKAD